MGVAPVSVGLLAIKESPGVLRWPVEPMRAAGVTDLPAPSRTSNIVYQPEWDGWLY